MLFQTLVNPNIRIRTTTKFKYHVNVIFKTKTQSLAKINLIYINQHLLIFNNNQLLKYFCDNLQMKLYDDKYFMKNNHLKHSFKIESIVFKVSTFYNLTIKRIQETFLQKNKSKCWENFPSAQVELYFNLMVLWEKLSLYV